MVEHRTRAGAPGRAGLGLVAFGGIVAAELEGVAALDQADALGGQAFKLDRADLRAVLLKLRAALGLLEHTRQRPHDRLYNPPTSIQIGSWLTFNS
jgi:hypothetical protein